MSGEVKAILLAAGLGTRLRPLTDTVPKCLVPIAGRPLLDFWIDQLADAGVRKPGSIPTRPRRAGTGLHRPGQGGGASPTGRVARSRAARLGRDDRRQR